MGMWQTISRSGAASLPVGSILHIYVTEASCPLSCHLPVKRWEEAALQLSRAAPGSEEA